MALMIMSNSTFEQKLSFYSKNSTDYPGSVWQIKRKTWKENLIADLQMGINSDPIPLPNSLEEINELEYKPVHVKGYFLHDKELFIGPRSLLVKGDSTTQSSFFADRSNSNGYLVVTPFKLANREETILVSRGWVPAKNRESKTRQNGQVEGPVDVIGIVRLHENRPSFTPKNKGK
ncbi:hypothetical protein NQ317_000138 [Molorchus minor]|uniref:SURF1-like protein n=1 Tax=Molorchus minor TaxID=1323400 RepID=A0ABQ9JU63_9CUCU|nr:hypothetical protein NQ317_000138 [Molorchus minor]